MVYYVEYVFAENFIIDFILLFITGKLVKKGIIYKRLIAASAVGALYVILTAYIAEAFMTYFIVKFSVSVLMLMIAFDCKGVLANIRVIICFYITSLIMVGIITGLYYFTYSKVTVSVIVISFFTGYVALSFFFKEIKLRQEKSNYMRTVAIGLSGRSKSIKGFIDTGNELSDPLTGKPVIVVNIQCIKNILGDELYTSVLSFYNKEKSYEEILSSHSDINLRIIRFNTISSKGEMMVCIIPDDIEIMDNVNKKDTAKKITADAIIGLYPKKISQKEDYDALLFNKILEWELEQNNELVNVC
ncbi:sigma-E processing peptidase SpoIIGA [Sedimentibacter sp.]|uniref:sigma-E processing peptidase SpoIIGA n=1 Tax=Sedimentibacter sp. TaxID=1960295 RepID=UPI0028A5E97C|nr:sigma-E processing peptidase SpoIIGA [Sedimentibacter sp.]